MPWFQHLSDYLLYVLMLHFVARRKKYETLYLQNFFLLALWTRLYNPALYNALKVSGFFPVLLHPASKLILFTSMSHFCTTWKLHKISGFLTTSRGMGTEHCREMLRKPPCLVKILKRYNRKCLDFRMKSYDVPHRVVGVDTKPHAKSKYTQIFKRLHKQRFLVPEWQYIIRSNIYISVTYEDNCLEHGPAMLKKAN